MNVRVNKWMGLIFLLVSPFFGGVFALVYLTEGFSFPEGAQETFNLVVFGLVPVIFFWVGVSTLIGRVYFKVDQNSLVLNAGIGPLKKNYRFQSLDELKVDKNKVYLNQDGKWKKLAIEYWSADRKDWDAFVQFIQHPRKQNSQE